MAGTNVIKLPGVENIRLVAKTCHPRTKRMNIGKISPMATRTSTVKKAVVFRHTLPYYQLTT